MYCGKCGAQNEDGARFCSTCGQPLEQILQPAEKKSHKGRNVAVVAVIVVLIAVIGTACYFLLGGKGYKEAVENFVNGAYQADAGKVMKVMPDKMVDDTAKLVGMSKSEFQDRIQQSLDSTTNLYEQQYGEGWRYGYEISSDEKMSKESLKSVQDTYKTRFDLKVKDARNLTIKIKLQSKDASKKDETSLNLQAVKIDGSWYLGMSEDEINNNFGNK